MTTLAWHGGDLEPVCISHYLHGFKFQYGRKIQFWLESCFKSSRICGADPKYGVVGINYRQACPVIRPVSFPADVHVEERARKLPRHWLSARQVDCISEME